MSKTCLFFTLYLIQSMAFSQTFNNPVFANGADPSCTFFNGLYYYMQTDGGLDVIQAPQIAGPAGLSSQSSYSVHAYTPAAPFNQGIEAPEITYLNGMWYIYYSAGTANDPNDISHRMFCLQASNPMGPYTYMGEVYDSSADYWAIDGHVLKLPNGSLYFVWCGRANSYNDGVSRLYIAPMSNPWTISGSRVLISSPTYFWENNINEAPAFLENNGKTFIIYSANCSCGNNYCLGQLENTDGNVLNPGSWSKKSSPVFQSYSGSDGTVYAPGSCTFTVSPDQTQDWIIYHTAQYSGSGFTREVHTQSFTWNSDGTPNFGHPIPTADPISVPSQNVIGDFDMDDLTDYVLFNPTVTNNNWSVRSSSGAGNVSSFSLGQSGDIPLIGTWSTAVDAETAVFRPSTGMWYVRFRDGSVASFSWGANGDIPLIGAWSGIMRDEVVFRPSNGAWYIRFGDTGMNTTIYWGGGGTNTSDIPLVGNFGGNGMIDQIAYRPSNGAWYVRDGKLGTSMGTFYWGGGSGFTNDIPLIGAWSGRMRDAVIFRPSTAWWYFRFGDTGGTASFQFGAPGDQPMIGNIFGHGMVDQIVFRPSTGMWYVRDGSNGNIFNFAFGTNQCSLVHE